MLSQDDWFIYNDYDHIDELLGKAFSHPDVFDSGDIDWEFADMADK